MSDLEVTARLENWDVREQMPGYSILTGNINEDIRERWSDGTFIYTSRFKSRELKEGDVVHTTYSVYKLGRKLECKR
ncbi:hypothetical protein N9924_00590 [bacterium]|nr:hypothetical protein [bacterium]